MRHESPPRCIADFTASPTDPPATEIGSVDGPNDYWSLGCRCSGRRFVVRSIFGPHFYLKHPTASGMIRLRCAICGRESACFVPSEHGYDAETDHFPPPKEDGDAELQEFACPNCEAGSFEVVARFEYPSDATEADLFTYFMLIVTCDACRRIYPIADVQCA